MIAGRSNSMFKLWMSQFLSMSLRSSENFQSLGVEGSRRLIAGSCDRGIRSTSCLTLVVLVALGCFRKHDGGRIVR